MTGTDLAYRKTAAEGASGFGLLIALYDTLASNLRRAAQAERNGDIKQRVDEINHALLVIGYLEDWLRRGSPGDLAAKLQAFYANLRRSLIRAQALRSAEQLEEQMTSVLKIREFWQQADMRGAAAGPAVLSPANPPAVFSYPSLQSETRRCSWSA